MKKTIKGILAIVLVTGFFQTTNAQNNKGFYVGFNAGYGINAGGTTNLAESFSLFNSMEVAPGVETFELEKFSLGKGINAGILAGYMFNKNIGVELGINYLSGSKTEFSRSFLDGSTESTEIKGKMLQFRPTLVLAAGTGKINPYTKFGLVIGKPNIEATETENDPSNATNSEFVLEFDSPLSLGFNAGVGVNFELTSKICLYTEILYTGLNVRPDSASITSATTNGIDVLPFLDISDRETEFVTEFNNGAPSNSNVPSKAPAIDLPFDNLVLQFGLKYGF